MRIPTRFAAVLIALIGSACFTSLASAGNPHGYDLASPDAIYTLPESLREMSALTYVNPEALVCVEDERGILYTYNPAANVITTQTTFGAEGDYEGLARVDETMYVLRSDGQLFEVMGYSSEAPEVILHETAVPAKNNEGLCYDKARNRLLIAAKSKSGKGSEFKDTRLVYEFDLKTRSMREEPVFVFDLQEITELARKAGVEVPEKKNKKKGEASAAVIQLRPSGIAVHPATEELYLLSGSNHLLVVFTMDGMLRYIEEMDPDIFNKPEGITFTEDGDMLISNEGETNKSATILRFNSKAR